LNRSQSARAGLQSSAIQPDLVPIPGGPFTIGITDAQIDWLAQRMDQAARWRDKGYFRREQPSDAVTLPGYQIGRYPVTVGQYRTFVAAGGYQHSSY
jgi:formylglycine-generating enzyme required for sulfatase activity